MAVPKMNLIVIDRHVIPAAALAELDVPSSAEVDHPAQASDVISRMWHISMPIASGLMAMGMAASGDERAVAHRLELPADTRQAALRKSSSPTIRASKIGGLLFGFVRSVSVPNPGHLGRSSSHRKPS